MRRLLSKAEEERKARRNKVVVGLIFIGVMFLSTVGYAFSSGGGTVDPSAEDPASAITQTYGGQTFTYQNGFWTAQIGGQGYIFSNSPSTAESLDVEVGTLAPLSSYQNQVLYYSSPQRAPMAELATNLNPLVQRSQEACLEGTTCEDGELPIKSCADHMIIIKESETSSITQQDNCLFIEGPSEDLVLLADEALFHLLGVK